MVEKQCKPGLFLSTRLNISITIFFLCLVAYSVRNDLSFAIVCMVNSTAVRVEVAAPEPVCATNISSSKKTPGNGKLVWLRSDQGYLLSSFYWGYIWTQAVGGYLALRLGGRNVIGVCMLSCAIITFISPVAANISLYFFIVLRVLMGLFQGTLYPSVHTLISRWSPPQEVSILIGIAYSGNQIGNVIVMPLSAWLCEDGFAGGWPSLFYVLGIAAMIWIVIWFTYVADSPQKSRWVSVTEREYIENSLKDAVMHDSDRNVRIPWKSIFKSAAVWGIFCGHFASDFGSYMMMTALPTFLSEARGLDLASMGMVSSIPYVLYTICIATSGVIADKIREACHFPTVWVRRAAMIIALMSQAGFLIACGFTTCDEKLLTVIFLTLGIGLSGIAYAGYSVNYIEIAPTFAGQLMGIGNMISCIGGILSPLLVGWITTQGTEQEWRVVFYITGAILVAGTTLYCLLTSSKVQTWAINDNDSDSDK